MRPAVLRTLLAPELPWWKRAALLTKRALLYLLTGPNPDLADIYVSRTKRAELLRLPYERS
jgi:hypothetical protein